MDAIRELALRNAHKFGKANEKAVFGAALSRIPELRKDLPEARKKISLIVKEVNALSEKDLASEYAKLPEMEKVVQKDKVLKPLPNANEGKVVMRFAPSPSGPMHVGHAYGLGLNYQYAQLYKGKFILRIEDTNPENIYAPAYDMVVDDANWLTDKGVSEVVIQSDRLGAYYDYAERLVSEGHAYLCECTSDAFREKTVNKEACPCRELPVKEHEVRYAKMFSSYAPGEAVLRAKTDITHKNPAMRDFPLMRINEHPHPRKGTEHRVWPLMNFSVFVDDLEYGITHVIRAKEHMDNAKRQAYLYGFVGKKPPEALFLGRINFSDMRVSCSKTKDAILEGKYTGWEDIRLPFLLPLRKRGYQPGAFLKHAVEIGVSATDKTVQKKDYFKSIDTFNREIIDPIANRYFFIKDPKKILVKDAEKRDITISVHPDYDDRGGRTFSTAKEFFIEKEDLEKLPEGLHRLMDCMNVLKKGDTFTFHSFEYAHFKDGGKRIIHWLPVSEELLPVKVHMPDGSVLEGLGEKGLSFVRVGDMVQLERFGFCRLEEREDILVFWFAHR